MKTLHKHNIFHTRYSRIRVILYFLCFFGISIAAIAFCGIDLPSLFHIALLMAATIAVLLISFPDNHLTDFIIFLLAPITIFYLAEWFTHVPWSRDISIDVMALNLIFYSIGLWFLFFLTGRLRLSLILLSVFSFTAAIANYYVTMFRSIPILPWDLKSLDTALSVANNFTFSVSYEFACNIGRILLFFALIGKVRTSIPSKRSIHKLRCYIVRLAGTGIFATLFCFYVTFLHRDDLTSYFRLNDTLFTPSTMYQQNGLAVNFIIDCKYLNVEIPNGYNKTEAKELLDQYQTSSPASKKPNIIVIMNETFSDPAVMGQFQTNKDYMPFIHSLQKGSPNAITGTVHTSIVGGNTANSEFEFLTGHTLAFLPTGCVAYQQYIHSAIPNLVQTLNNANYNSYGIHPYRAAGWNRQSVYSLLGFQHRMFLDDFKNAPILREYVSDQACVDTLIDLYENKTNHPLFLFNVTMQNHSWYDKAFENFDEQIQLTGIDDTELNRYLSLMYESDQAFEHLTKYFSNAEEDTIIVMFGDHQPNNYLIRSICEKNGLDVDNLSTEDLLKRYTVPYVIWANFELPDIHIPDISINYLNGVVMDLAGLPKSPYQNFLSQLRIQYPVITSMCWQDSNGVYHTWDEPSIPEPILQYKKLQYYQLFDATANRF
ncbi:MAG: sulfatase-like hydrolase/transferase [Clostridiales bacterium]|nr:sulfatase-like hydrolase/transferase [Clostridiales bacterium]